MVSTKQKGLTKGKLQNKKKHRSISQTGTNRTHLHRHGDVLLSNIVVVLVSVEHDDSVGQGKACIVGHEGRAVHFLQTHTQTPHDYKRFTH